MPTRNQISLRFDLYLDAEGNEEKLIQCQRFLGRPLMSECDVGLSTRSDLMNATSPISHDVILGL